MSFKVKTLRVGKGRTIERNGENPEWSRQYYEIELEIQDDRDLEIAKASVESLIDGWLTAQRQGRVPIPAETPTPQAPTPLIGEPDVEQLEWLDRTSQKGPYEICEDFGNPHYKALLEQLNRHNGKLRKAGFFYWIFQNGHTIGRKKKK